jgi:hypothetical protein
MAGGDGWHFMQDGVLFAEFNHQGSPRGGDEFVAPNWWMGMAGRNTPKGRLTFIGMFSLDPATVGRDGYRELLQTGESLDGQPLVDRQHPHDLFMQLAAVWRLPLTGATGLTLAGGPVGEPALGPVAFVHRASAADNPSAPLGHHTFDSTHVSFGVVTAAVDHGHWLVEGSLFNGREPDDNRWDFDLGALDSFSGRVWYRPDDRWEFQASSGRLKDPEALEPGNIVRSTASLSWTRTMDAAVTAITLAYGRNDTDHGARNAVLVEGGWHTRLNTAYGRLEILQVETELLQGGHLPEAGSDSPTDPVVALTLGGVRNVFRGAHLEGGLGADVTFNVVPQTLEPEYGRYPIGFHVFFRLRPAGRSAHRMWNARMSQPMR